MVKKRGLSQNQFAFENFTLFDTVLMGNKRLYDAIKRRKKSFIFES